MKFNVAIGAIFFTPVTADMYLQFPGGSSNRLNEPNRATRNQNRLFDSQNNNRFGHNQHGHYFYTDSEIDMQWTVQHSCGPESNLNCDIILQYACEENLRDGEIVNTIPIKSEDCKNSDCNLDFHYGMHEDYQSYQHCSLRERNKGLFPADRRIRGDDARFTRQENNGARYGYECNEERDHYPYWHPTIWKDIAVFTDDTSRCEYYEEESENIKGRWYCDVSDDFLNDNYNPGNRDAIIPINKEDCEDLEGAEWVSSAPHTYPNGENMKPPICQEAPYQRDNHHGNGDSGYFVGYKWTVPENLVHPNCAVRIRYNITSSDVDAWKIDYDAMERNNRLSRSSDIHEGNCYGVGEGPAKIGGSFVSDNNIDMNNTLVVTPKRDIRIQLTRNSTDIDSWRLQTGAHNSFQWVGWKNRDFRNKQVKVSFDVKFATKPTEGNYGMKFYGTLVSDWVDTAPLGEWYRVELEQTLPRGGDGDHVILIFDGVSVDLELRDFKICVYEEAIVCYGLGEGAAKIGGSTFTESNIDIDNALVLLPKRNLRIKMTRNATESDLWRVETFAKGNWQWIGWQDEHLAYKNVKVTFDVKFTTKPTIGNNYGMKFFGKIVKEWVDEAEVGVWHRVELKELLPRNGDNYHIIMTFDKNLVDLELKDFNLCIEDELTDGNNPYSSMQNAFDWDPYTAKRRGYEHKNDPKLQIFERIPMKLRSAYNTDQLGRVFEDRSHKIKFLQLPTEIKQDMRDNNKKLYNLNARGKIGNNVEVYPAFEYDFAPSRLEANEGDYVHIQWSGSNTNDHGNDHSQTDNKGQTVRILRGKDRHNMVAIDRMDDIRPTGDLKKIASLLGLSAEDSMKLAFSGVEGGDNEYLQSAGAYFDLGPRKLTKKGKHMFMSTVNNANGVRTQKGKIIVN